jgi:hypothetical protein
MSIRTSLAFLVVNIDYRSFTFILSSSTKTWPRNVDGHGLDHPAKFDFKHYCLGCLDIISRLTQVPYTTVYIISRMLGRSVNVDLRQVAIQCERTEPPSTARFPGSRWCNFRDLGITDHKYVQRAARQYHSSRDDRTGTLVCVGGIVRLGVSS